MKGKNHKVAVLADMLELGENSPLYHKEVGTYLADTSITDLFAVGDLIDHTIAEVKEKNPSVIVRKFDDNESLTAALQKFLQPGDAVLLKGSNGMKLKEVAAAL